jgi:energy-coupling factor transporter ATP-binding protein EcfA2
VNDLRGFVNLEQDRDWLLLVSWLVAALRPTGPYPVLVLQGEQGSGKSTVARILKCLLDPAAVNVRTPPREERDLMIAATNNWALAFDNLSGLRFWLSDALCRLATGGGFGTRELYSDADEILFDAQRPVIANGIEDIITRGDLMDRSIILHLPPIAKEERKPEADLWNDFKKASPRILGALLEAVCVALRELPGVNLPALPRMADFAEWVTAAEGTLPWPKGAFLAAYSDNRAGAVESIFEADTVASAVREMMEMRSEWAGTATELLEVLEGYVPEKMRKTKHWPNGPRQMANRLRRAASCLRQAGVEVVFGEREPASRRRLIRIESFSLGPIGPMGPDEEDGPPTLGISREEGGTKGGPKGLEENGMGPDMVPTKPQVGGFRTQRTQRDQRKHLYSNDEIDDSWPEDSVEEEPPEEDVGTVGPFLGGRIPTTSGRYSRGPVPASGNLVCPDDADVLF